MKQSVFNYYVASDSNSIELLLRRTLQGSVILSTQYLNMFFLKKFFSKKSNTKYHLIINPTEGVNASYDINFNNSKSIEGYYLVIDTETTGLPKNEYDKPENLNNWPYIVSVAWLLFDKEGYLINENYHIIKQSRKIPEDSIRIHKITDEIAAEKGEDPKIVFEKLLLDEKNSKILVAHNIDFDLATIQSEFIRNNLPKPFLNHEKVCTMKNLWLLLV